MSIKAVLFDKDGTLFKFGATWETWAVNVLNRLTDGDAEQARTAAEAIGFDFDRQTFSPDSIVIAGTPEEVVNAMAGIFDINPDALETIINEEAARAPQAEAVPLAIFLQNLRDMGLKLGVATNDAEMPARAHLEAANVTHLFDFIAGYDSGYGGKPAPGQCLGFAKSVGVDPSEVAMVGDSLHDLHAGHAAGMATVGVLTGLATHEELSPHADEVFADISGLLNWSRLSKISV